MFKIIFTRKIFWIIGASVLSLLIILKFDFKKIGKLGLILLKLIKTSINLIFSLILGNRIKLFQTEDSG